LVIFITACSSPEPDEEIKIEAGEPLEELLLYELPNTVRVLSENSIKIALPDTELLDVAYILETLELTNDFPGTYIVSRKFAEQMVNTLISLGHTITNEYITDVFIYLHMEYGNYNYLIWWSNNQLMLTGDFVIIRESFLR